MTEYLKQGEWKDLPVAPAEYKNPENFRFPEGAELDLLDKYIPARENAKLGVGSIPNVDDLKKILPAAMRESYKDLVRSVGGEDVVIAFIEAQNDFARGVAGAEQRRNDGAYEIFNIAAAVAEQRGVFDTDIAKADLVKVDLSGYDPGTRASLETILDRVRGKAFTLRDTVTWDTERNKAEAAIYLEAIDDAAALGAADVVAALQVEAERRLLRHYGKDLIVAGERECPCCGVVMSALSPTCPRDGSPNEMIFINPATGLEVKRGPVKVEEFALSLEKGNVKEIFGPERMDLMPDNSEMKFFAQRVNATVAAGRWAEIKNLREEAERKFGRAGGLAMDIERTMNYLELAAIIVEAKPSTGGMFAVKEIVMTEEYWGKARQYLGEIVEADNGQGNLEDSLKNLEANFVKRAAGEFSGKIPDLDLEKMREELRARLELKRVDLWWQGTTEFSEGRATPSRGLAERITSYPKVSKETYKWMMEQDRYVVLEGGVAREIDLRQQVDLALSQIWYAKGGGVGSDFTQSYERARNFLSTQIPPQSLNEEAFRLAWRVAVAEMWPTEFNGSKHPAARIINFAGFRWEKSSSNAVWGGRRLYFEYREKNPTGTPPEVSARGSVFELSAEQLKENPYQLEGRGFAGTGIFFIQEGSYDLRSGVTVTVDDPRLAIRQGRYLENMRKYWDAKGEFSPQERAMESLETGIKVGVAIKEMLGGEAQKDFGAAKLGTLVPWIFMVKDEVVAKYLPDGWTKDDAVNQYFREWAKSLVWGYSLMNPDIATNREAIDKGLLATSKQVVDTFRAILTAKDGGSGSYIGRDRQRGVVRPVLEQRKEINDMIAWYKKYISRPVVNGVADKNPLLIVADLFGRTREFQVLRNHTMFSNYHIGIMAGEDMEVVHKARGTKNFVRDGLRKVGRVARLLIPY